MPEVTADGRPLIKCTSCKAFRLTEEFENDKHGHRRRTCLICKTKRTEKKCEHNKRKQQCKQCGGISLCIHQTRSNECKQCGGASICNHGKMKHLCFKCDPCSALWARANSRIKNV